MSNPPLPGWLHQESPFHHGERAVQERLGVADKLEVSGRRVIRNFMPDQHREFFAQLPFVLVGSVDREGQPWASVLTGQPGFMTSPDPHRLDVRSQPVAGDPLGGTLVDGATLGLLGIEPHTRRRNRMNGTVLETRADGFSLQVNRSFGNCPKYIQARQPILVSMPDAVPPQQRMQHSAQLDEAMCRLIRGADTFFIATALDDKNASPACPHGADVSHRGGKPGFVSIDDPKTLTVPDFIGNFSSTRWETSSSTRGPACCSSIFQAASCCT